MKAVDLSEGLRERVRELEREKDYLEAKVRELVAEKEYLKDQLMQYHTRSAI